MEAAAVRRCGRACALAACALACAPACDLLVAGSCSWCPSPEDYEYRYPDGGAAEGAGTDALRANQLQRCFKNLM